MTSAYDSGSKSGRLTGARLRAASAGCGESNANDESAAVGAIHHPCTADDTITEAAASDDAMRAGRVLLEV